MNTFYKFKNKVDLIKKETFGYLENSILNNELNVYLNNALDNSDSLSITNYNLGYDVNEIVALFWKDANNIYNHKTFKDDSLFGDDHQPKLTEYIDYKGNIFELYRRLNIYIKNKISREQIVKRKYINWFDPTFLNSNNSGNLTGLQRIAKYVFNPDNTLEDIDYKGQLNSENVVFPFNEYFRIKSTSSEIDPVYITADSNSIVPSRIYYKTIKTETENNYEYKFIFPLYIHNDIDVLKSLSNYVVVENLELNLNNEIKQGGL